jgi:hypothetical protein
MSIKERQYALDSLPGVTHNINQIIKNTKCVPDLLTHTCNLSSWAVKLQAQAQPRPHHKTLSKKQKKDKQLQGREM